MAGAVEARVAAQDPRLQLETARSVARERPHAASELSDSEPRPQLREALAVSSELVDPDGDLVAEGDRQAGLAVRATRPSGSSGALARAAERPLDRREVRSATSATRTSATAYHVSVMSWTVAP